MPILKFADRDLDLTSLLDRSRTPASQRPNQRRQEGFGAANQYQADSHEQCQCHQGRHMPAARQEVEGAETSNNCENSGTVPISAGIDQGGRRDGR